MDLRGHLDLLLLEVLARTGEAHGYALISALKEGSEGWFDLPEGTVYPALHRLERSGLVSSSWSADAPRRRRVYRLTDAGEAALAAERREWRSFARAVELIQKLPPRISTAQRAGHLVPRVQSLSALAWSRWPLAAFSVARVPPVRRAPCGLASHPAVLQPPSQDLGHGTLANLTPRLAAPR
jgi:PadR family transcriptional regulator PadR